MYIPLILFFASFFSIVFMIGRKLGKVDALGIPDGHEYEIPYIKEVGPGAVRNAKKYGHAGVVMGVRMYVKSSKTLRNTYKKVKITVKNLHTPKPGEKEKEISKFLKGVSDYKRKVRAIKNKISREEENK